MRVSAQRLQQIEVARVAALKLLEADGIDTITRSRTSRIVAKNVDVGELRIGLWRRYGTETIDIWHGNKVMSVATDPYGKLDVISFKPGPWQSILAEAA
jgi:hypothetical protein